MFLKHFTWLPVKDALQIFLLIFFGIFFSQFPLLGPPAFSVSILQSSVLESLLLYIYFFLISCSTMYCITTNKLNVSKPCRHYIVSILHILVFIFFFQAPICALSSQLLMSYYFPFNLSTERDNQALELIAKEKLFISVFNKF